MFTVAWKKKVGLKVHVTESTDSEGPKIENLTQTFNQIQSLSKVQLENELKDLIDLDHLSIKKKQ